MCHRPLFSPSITPVRLFFWRATPLCAPKKPNATVVRLFMVFFCLFHPYYQSYERLFILWVVFSFFSWENNGNGGERRSPSDISIFESHLFPRYSARFNDEILIYSNFQERIHGRSVGVKTDQMDFNFEPYTKSALERHYSKISCCHFFFFFV